MRRLKADFQELVSILRQAQDAVREELGQLRAQEVDNKACLRLLTSVRSFADQAQTLFMMMADSDTDEASTLEVSDLAESFCATEDLIELALGLDRA